MLIGSHNYASDIAIVLQLRGQTQASSVIVSCLVIRVPVRSKVLWLGGFGTLGVWDKLGGILGLGVPRNS